MRLLVPRYRRVDALPRDTRESLIHEITDLDAEVFRDPAPDHVADAYRGVGVDECWTMTVRHRGRLVAYNTIRVWFEQGPDGPYALWRSRAAVRHAYRRASMTGHFATVMYVWFRLRHPRLPLYTVNTLVHPSSFRLFATRIASLYPFPNTELSTAHRAIYEHAIQRLGLQRIEGSPDFVVRDPTIVDTDPQEAARWAASEAPCIRFFFKHNAEYWRGRAIASFLPLTASVVLGFTYRLAARKIEKKMRALFSRGRRSPATAPVSSPPDPVASRESP